MRGPGPHGRKRRTGSVPASPRVELKPAARQDIISVALLNGKYRENRSIATAGVGRHGHGGSTALSRHFADCRHRTTRITQPQHAQCPMTDYLETKGLVFDVQRCSLHDGPGIRTTVFLKGCPLRCIWCHNPESQVPRPELSFNAERCVHCMRCVDACPVGAHRNEDGRHVVDRGRCVLCGACVEACLVDALSIIGDERTVREVIDEVERDRPFYDNSGGGMTISGGEPMAQFEYTVALLKAARERDIHTCIETCGFAPRERYEQLLPLVDLFLFDYKATGSDLHEELTGVPNERIVGNLEFLLASGAAVVLRCPMVPGVNDTDEHLEAIAELSAAHPELEGVQLMPYHDLGRSKSERLGHEPQKTWQRAEDEHKQEWLRRLAGLGCERATIS